MSWQDWQSWVFGLMDRVLVWPVAVVIVALIFRSQVREAIGRITGVKAGGVEVALVAARVSVESAGAGDVAEAPAPGEAASEPEPATTASTETLSPVEAQFVDVLRSTGANGSAADPAAVIDNAWTGLLSAIDTLARVAKFNPPGALLGTRTARDLAKGGVVNEAFADAVHDLQLIRNRVVHSWSERPTQADALEYVRLAD